MCQKVLLAIDEAYASRIDPPTRIGSPADTQRDLIIGSANASLRGWLGDESCTRTGDMMNTRQLLSATAVLYWLIAFMKIFATHTFHAPSGIDLTERVATIPQAERAAFIGLPDELVLVSGNQKRRTGSRTCRRTAGELSQFFAGHALASTRRGILVPSEDPVASAHAIEDLVGDADRRLELDRRALDTVTDVARRFPLFGGQGIVNVNSWTSDGHRFAFVAYPMQQS